MGEQRVVTGSKALPGKFEYSTFSGDLDLAKPRSFAEIVAMSPADMAHASRLVNAAYNELLQVAASLEDSSYRRLMTECITTPKVTFLEMYPTDEDRRRLFAEMVRLGFFNKEDFSGTCMASRSHAAPDLPHSSIQP